MIRHYEKIGLMPAAPRTASEPASADEVERKRLMRTLVAFVNLRTLFAMFVVLAVLIAPAVGHGDALAAVPHHDVQMIQSGHCHSPVSQKDRHAHDMGCCAAMSIGIAPTVTAAADEASDQVAPASVRVAPLHRPFLGELATPPPRSA